MLAQPLVGVRDSLRVGYIESVANDEANHQRAILLARKYHEGQHGGELTERLRQFIRSFDEGHPFSMNVCRSVITALTERLSIQGFDCADKTIIEWAEKMWADNVMAALQDDVYEWALRDGESFIVVGWDEEEERARLTLHPRYTDLNVDGDGYGCTMTYTQNDPNQKALFATKYWTEEIDNELRQRKTMYFPDRIEKWIMGERDWLHYKDVADEDWPIPWKDADGKPLGIAVIHFKNKGLRCEAWDTIPLQDAVNKELVDLLMAGDATAFRIFYAMGFIPTTNGKPPADDRSNWQRIEPGEIVATTKNASEASFGAIDGADLTPLQDLVHQLVMWSAMVSETPITRFITTKLIASDETLKEQENPLLSRVRVRQVLFGSAWATCLDMTRKIYNLWGEAGLKEDQDVLILWKDAQIRGETEKLKNLGLKKSLGIPRTQLWKEAGYDQATIAKMMEESNNDNQNQGSNQPGVGVPGNGNGSPGNGAGNGNGNNGNNQPGANQKAGAA